MRFSLILFLYSLMIGYAIKNRKSYPGKEMLLDKKKKPQLKFNQGLALNRRLNNWAQEYQNKSLHFFFYFVL